MPDHSPSASQEVTMTVTSEPIQTIDMTKVRTYLFAHTNTR